MINLKNIEKNIEKNFNVINLISLAEDSLRIFTEDKVSAKDAVLQARCKEAAREGKNLFDESLTTEEEAFETDLWNLALEGEIQDTIATFGDYMDWLKKNNLEDSDEAAAIFRNVRKTVDSIVDCLRAPRLIEKKKSWLGEEAVELLNYIVSGGISHKVPSFVEA